MHARCLTLALVVITASAARADDGDGSLRLDGALLADVAAAVVAATGAQLDLSAWPLELPPLRARFAQADTLDEEEESDEERRRRRRRRDDDDGESRSSARGGSVERAVGGSGFSPMGRQFGIGLQLGLPTAVTIKYMVTPDQGLVAGLGVGSGWIFDPGLSVHVDYVWHPTMLASASAFNLSWYIGGGGWVSLFPYPRGVPYVAGFRWYSLGSQLWLGARLPIGVNLALREVPFEIYGEAAPALLVFPTLTFGIGFVIGARFYF